MNKWILLVLLIIGQFDCLAVEGGSLLVGAAKRKITPPVGVPLAGYGSGRFAEGVHDDLWVRSCVITTDEQTVVFVSLDLIGILFDEVELISDDIDRVWRIPKANVFIACTHTHSGPDTIGLWGGRASGKDPQYLSFVRQQSLSAVSEALEGRQKAAIKFGQARYSNPVEDARPPQVIDDYLTSLQAVSLEGKTIVTLVNYAMHAEVLDQKNRLITSDYPGVLREELERKLGGTSLFFAGDIGGMQTPKLFLHNFSNRKRIGKKLARHVLKSLKNSPVQKELSTHIQSEEIFFPIENKRFTDSLNAGIFGDLKDKVVFKDGEWLLPSRINIAQLGSILFISIPGELFPETGHRLRENIKRDPIFLLGLCNNEIGYIVPQEEWMPQGYEETMSLGPKTEKILVETILNLTAALPSKP